MKFIDLTGQKFGKLTVEKLHEKIQQYKNNKKSGFKYYFLCKCECGNKKIVESYLLISGQTKSCGCINKSQCAKINYKHGLCNIPLYRVWIDIKSRCLNSRQKNYKHYGARGIKVCDEWKNDFLIFYKWSIENGYKEGLTIDRIDTNGNYEPINCRWISQKEQCNNKRNNCIVQYKDKSLTVKEWSEVLNIKYITLKKRLDRGWNIEKALFTQTKNNML